MGNTCIGLTVPLLSWKKLHLLDRKEMDSRKIKFYFGQEFAFLPMGQGQHFHLSLPSGGGGGGANSN